MLSKLYKNSKAVLKNNNITTALISVTELSQASIQTPNEQRSSEPKAFQLKRGKQKIIARRGFKPIKIIQGSTEGVWGGPEQQKTQ